MQEMIAKNEVAGAVTAVVTKNKILHFETTGYADVAAKRPMASDTLFWIASMTKPITGAAILMLQDEGKLHVSDPVAKYLPEFANLKTPSGKPANLTITQMLTHTSGSRRGDRPGRAASQNARRPGPDLARRADEIRARRTVAIHAERHQRRRAHRRGRERHDLRRVSPEAAVRPARDEAHDVLHRRRATRPACHRLREEQGNRSARTGAAAPRIRPARPAAAGQRRTLLDRARLSCASARCSSTAGRSTAAAISAPPR